MKSCHTVSIILPTYNESENIGRLIYAVAQNVNRPLEVIIVDDDSPDQTWKVVQGVRNSNKNIKLLRRIGKRGLTSAISDGISLATGDVIVWMDCDFSMPPEKIPELLKKIDEGYDIAVGSRFIKGGKDIRGTRDSLIAVILSRILNLFIMILLHPSFKDYTSGFIAAKVTVFDDMRLRGDYGEYFIDLIYRAIKKGYKVVEIPYICIPRKYGVSKTGTNFFQYLKRGLKYIATTLRLRFSKVK